MRSERNTIADSRVFTAYEDGGNAVRLSPIGEGGVHPHAVEDDQRRGCSGESNVKATDCPGSIVEGSIGDSGIRSQGQAGPRPQVFAQREVVRLPAGCSDPIGAGSHDQSRPAPGFRDQVKVGQGRDVAGERIVLHPSLKSSEEAVG